MDFVLGIVLPLYVLCFGQFISITNGNTFGAIEVSNGMNWGAWGHKDMCPYGTYATGFSLKVEHSVGDGDDTALNGIALRCTKPFNARDRSHYSSVQSDVGSWGSWTQNVWCTKGVLQAFQLRVEPFQKHGDDTAVNNIRFICSGEEILTGNGMSWGKWGRWSSACHGLGICGIQTKVEPPQGAGDDTALNDVRFYCC